MTCLDDSPTGWFPTFGFTTSCKVEVQQVTDMVYIEAGFSSVVSMKTFPTNMLMLRSWG